MHPASADQAGSWRPNTTTHRDSSKPGTVSSRDSWCRHPAGNAALHGTMHPWLERRDDGRSHLTADGRRRLGVD